MKIDNFGGGEIGRSDNLGGETSFTIENSPFAFKILSESLYSHKIQSVIRELSTNAADELKRWARCTIKQADAAQNLRTCGVHAELLSKWPATAALPVRSSAVSGSGTCMRLSRLTSRSTWRRRRSLPRVPSAGA